MRYVVCTCTILAHAFAYRTVRCITPFFCIMAVAAPLTWMLLADAGQALAYATTAPAFGRGWHLLGPDADPCRPIKAHTDAARNLAWSHTEEAVAAALR